MCLQTGVNRYIPVDTTPNFTVSSNLTEVSKKKRAAAPLRPARRRAGMREALKRPYSCDICRKRYSQPQGLSRHHQEEHNPHSCLYCGFKWSRPYQYRSHLERQHLDVNPDDVLGKPAGSRRKSTIIGRNLPQHFFSPAIDLDRQSQTQRPLMPPLPAMATATQPYRLSVSYYDPRPERAGPAVTSHKREEAGVLELSDISDIIGPDVPSAFLFAEERAQPAKDVGISIQRGQLWLAHAFC